jgi:hypothetical protein
MRTSEPWLHFESQYGLEEGGLLEIQLSPGWEGMDLRETITSLFFSSFPLSAETH